MVARSHRCLARCAAAALALGSVSCGEGPTTPSPGGSSATAAVRLDLVAPREIAPGESVQLTANAVRSDGSVENVTRQAQWTVESVPTAVLALMEPGLATGAERGRALVKVRFADLTSEATIFVLPRGTFRLTGKITADGVGLEDVAVAVVAGVGEGLTARTNVSGDYELYGAAGSVYIRASKEGYFERIQQADVISHRAWSFELSPRTATHYAGVYILTVTARSCTSGFPEAAKRRVYKADVQQEGGDLRVFLSGADLLPRSNAFTGELRSNNTIRFVIEPGSVWDYGGPDMQERLPDGTVLLTHGVIVATSTPTGISGTAPDQEAGLGGLYHLPPPGPVWSLNFATGSCSIDRFEMVRQ